MGSSALAAGGHSAGALRLAGHCRHLRSAVLADLFGERGLVTLSLVPIHRRPSVTEQSVEGPGTSRRPTQEDEALPPALAAGGSQRPVPPPAPGRSSFLG